MAEKEIVKLNVVVVEGKLHEHVFRWKHATAVKVFKLFSVGVVKLLWVSREMSVNYVYLCEVDHYI